MRVCVCVCLVMNVNPINGAKLSGLGVGGCEFGAHSHQYSHNDVVQPTNNFNQIAHDETNYSYYTETVVEISKKNVSLLKINNVKIYK